MLHIPRTIVFLLLGSSLAVLVPSFADANSWNRGGTRCPFLDIRADPVYQLNLTYVAPARINQQRKDWSTMEVHAHSELFYFRDVLLGDMELRVNMQSTFPLNGGGLRLPDHLLALSIPLSWTWRYVNDTALRLHVQPGFYSEIKSLGGDALSIPTGLLFVRTMNPTFTAIAGLTIRPRFERPVMPTAGIIWQPLDSLHLQGTVPAGRLTYYFIPKWSCELSWDWFSMTYLLPDDSRNRRNVTLEESRFELAVTREFSPELRIRAGLGLAGGRSISFHREGESAINHSMFISIGAGGAF